MSRNLKIEKINAYKKMIESKRLPKIDEEAKQGPRNPDDPSTFSVEEQIHMEFEGWAEQQLADLLGENMPQLPAAFGFTDEQEDVLRQFADKMIAKANAGPTEPSAPRPARKEAPRTSSSAGGYKPPANAAPIGNRLRDRTAKSSKTTPENDKYLKELDRLDRETPDFD
jgi:hypothetical protein